MAEPQPQQQPPELVLWKDLKDQCAAILDHEHPFAKHFVGDVRRIGVLSQAIIRVSARGIFWITQPLLSQQTSIAQIDQQLAETTTFVETNDFNTSALMSTGQVRIEMKNKTELVIYIPSHAEDLNHAVSVTFAHPLPGSGAKDPDQDAKPTDPHTNVDGVQVYDKAEFRLHCAELHNFVSSHHMRGRQHITVGSINDLLAARQDKSMHNEVKNMEVALIATLVLVLAVSPLGGLLVGLISIGAVSHSAREKVRKFIRDNYIHATKHGRVYFKLNHSPEAHIFYYHDEYFGVVQDPQPKGKQELPN